VHNFFRDKQFQGFLLVGAVAALLNFLSRIVINIWVNFSTAIIISYILGMITAFYLNRKFVFKSTILDIRKSFSFFLLINILAIIQIWMVSMILAYFIFPYFKIHNHIYEISHLFGIIVPIFTSYIGHKKFSFQ